MTKKIIITTLIAGTLGMLLYLFFPKEINGTTTTNLSDLPDIYLRGVQIQAFDTSGKLAYELRAEEIEQFSTVHKMLFKDLNIQVERDNGETWYMNAQEGSIQPGSEQPTQILEPIQLLGTVHVYSGGVNNPEYSFRGANVVYDPRDSTIYSNEPNFVKAGESTYNADGFQFDLTTKQLNLRSEPGNQVDIQYESDDTE